MVIIITGVYVLLLNFLWMTDDMMKNEDERRRIGSDIAERRKQLGKTQADIADVTGLQRNHISRIEQGRYSVGFDTLQIIADALDADIRVVPRQ